MQDGSDNSHLDDLAETVSSAEEKITTVFDWYERWFRSPDFHGCLFAHALAEFGDARHPVFQAVARHKDGLRHRLQDILEVAMPADRAQSAATALFMLLEGATLLAHGAGRCRHARCTPSGIEHPRHAGTTTMTATVITLALFAAILHATWNVFCARAPIVSGW